MQKELCQVCVFYALTPLHAGSGQAIGAVDLPIQRERHTQWPQVQASGVKGAFRDWFYRFYKANGGEVPEAASQCQALTEKIFGQAEEGREGKEGQAGAVAFTDARLLAFPVRSQVAPFVWVTCPGVLTRLKRDLRLAGLGWEVAQGAPSGEDAFVPIRGNFTTPQVILEDLAVSREENSSLTEKLAEVFQKLAPQVERLLLISDQRFSFLVRTATEVQAQIAIDPATGTTKTGSLRYQELLPADSVLYTLVFIGGERTSKENGLLPGVIKDCLGRAVSSHLQMGGDMTLGRGLMEVCWLPEAAHGGAK
jgi:CRISPR-associated protein Cmr4